MSVFWWLYNGLASTWRNGPAYNFVSGDLGDTALLGGIWLLYRKHNCHVHHCWRLSWHPHPEHGHPVCRVHHPHSKSISA